MFRHVYLSPHYDDASLSCGGTIHRQVQDGQPVLVVTVCAASPPPHESLSAFATDLHESWGNPEDVVATRQAEDRASMEILGADYLRLHLTDCIYRGRSLHGEWYYNDNTELFGQVHPVDLLLTTGVTEAIIEMIPQEDGMVLYIPLTVGHHIDHQLVHAAGWQLRQQGWTVVFYEDYPYVDPVFAGQDSSYSLEATLSRLEEANLIPQLRFFSEDNLQAKIDSIAAYASQLDMLFGGYAQIEKQVRDYALQVGEGSLAERIWIPGQAT
jgi:LmbE family N-acetylglucosaminyl deacetylase